MPVVCLSVCLSVPIPVFLVVDITEHIPGEKNIAVSLGQGASCKEETAGQFSLDTCRYLGYKRTSSLDTWVAKEYHVT